MNPSKGLAGTVLIGIAGILSGCGSGLFPNAPTTDRRDTAFAIVSSVNRYTRLDRVCFDAAMDVVETGIGERVSIGQRAVRMREEAREDRIAYEAHGCPVAALAGLSFGVSEATNEALKALRATGGGQ